MPALLRELRRVSASHGLTRLEPTDAFVLLLSSHTELAERLALEGFRELPFLRRYARLMARSRSA
jgi:hypothetical protein